MTKVNQKNWSCPKKKEARKETILDQYRQYYGYHLPKNDQYWSMAGQCATPEGLPQKGCELDQMISENLITENQFHGVEIEKDIYDLNVKAYPNSNWYNEDFLVTMENQFDKQNFNPGIVNADLISTPETGCEYISECLEFLSQFNKNIMFIANFITQMRHYSRKNVNYIESKLKKEKSFILAMMKGNWKFNDDVYSYWGTGNNKAQTVMTTLIFTKYEINTYDKRNS